MAKGQTVILPGENDNAAENRPFGRCGHFVPGGVSNAENGHIGHRRRNRSAGDPVGARKALRKQRGLHSGLGANATASKLPSGSRLTIRKPWKNRWSKPWRNSTPWSPAAGCGKATGITCSTCWRESAGPPAYRHVRMGPGKSAGFGTAGKKPVFCLPGGPPSNHTALVLLALPGLLKMAGCDGFSLPVARARLSNAIRGQVGWTPGGSRSPGERKRRGCFRSPWR